MKIYRETWRYLAMAAAVLLLLFILAKLVFAAGTTATLSWTHPTAYTDGSALPVSDIKETLITWRRPNSTIIVGTVRVPAPATSRVVSGLACGSFNFTAQTVIKTTDIQSDESMTVPYATGIPCAPHAPTGLKVE